MKIFNFSMPDPLRQRLLAEKDRTGLSEAEIVRRALDEHLEIREQRDGVPKAHRVRGVASTSR